MGDGAIPSHPLVHTTMNHQPESCKGCPLYDDKVAIGFMRPEGTGSSGVLVIAEALGEREANESLPLRPNAPAGSVFQGIIRRIAGLDRNQLLLSNTLWCRPGNRNWLDGAPYEYAAIEHCQQYNGKLIQDRRPRTIVTLGAIPTRTVTGMVGYNQGVKLIRGFILKSSRPEYQVDGQSIPVIASYHPSFLLRASKTRSKDKDSGGTGAKIEKAEGGMSLAGVVTSDILLALRIAREGVPAPHQFEAIHGNRDVMEALYRDYQEHPEWDIAWDIETPRSIAMSDDESEIDSIQAQVTQIQFAHHSDKGYVFPGFEAQYVKEFTQKLLALPNRKLSWNGWKFDNKVVSGHHGIPILGEDVDLMAAWRWIQPDLPRGLQFATSFHAPHLAPWKHLSGAFYQGTGDDTAASMDTYGACDVVSLILNRDGIFKTMDSRGLRTSFDRHVIKLRTEMVAAQHRGFPVDPVKHEAFGKKVFDEIQIINDAIQAIIPEEVLGWGTKSKVGMGFVNTPKQLLPFLDDSGNPSDGTDRVSLIEEVPVEDDEGNPTDQVETKTVVYTRRTVEILNKESLEMEGVVRWGRIKPFSVGSGQQKIRYIEFKREQEIRDRMAKGQDRANAERLAKYSVPKVRNKQKELKDNTGAKEMEKLYKETGDLVFKHLVDIGKLKKLHGTYYKGWKVRNGFVHTTFGLADTGTGQLSSTDPNIQNAPKHSNLAKEFRGCIAAKPGRMLVEIDKKSFHAQTLAFEAHDKTYARLSAIDVHSYMTAHRLKFPEAHQLLNWSDKDMNAWFKEKKADATTIYKSEAVPNYPDGLTFQQVRDYKSKKVILGIGFCQGALSIFEQNPEGYKDKKEVQTFLDLFGEIFDKVKKFQAEITQLAHKQTYLTSRWGYIRRFYDVFQWQPMKWNPHTGSMGDWGHGDDFEAAVAFLPANDAFGMIKEEMLRLAGYRGGYVRFANKEGEDLLEKYNFINQIHDSLIFHPLTEQVDKCLEDVLYTMREPCPILYWEGMEKEGLPGWTKDGLFVDAEAMVGPDWAHMAGVKG